SRSSARDRVMEMPRVSAAPPSTTRTRPRTDPKPINALTTESDTSTARDEPDPCGTTMTVQRRSVFWCFWLTQRPKCTGGAKIGPGTGLVNTYQPLSSHYETTAYRTPGTPVSPRAHARG